MLSWCIVGVDGGQSVAMVLLDKNVFQLSRDDHYDCCIGPVALAVVCQSGRESCAEVCAEVWSRDGSN